MSAVTLIEFELVYYDFAVQYIRCYDSTTLLNNVVHSERNVWISSLKHEWKNYIQFNELLQYRFMKCFYSVYNRLSDEDIKQKEVFSYIYMLCRYWGRICVWYKHTIKFFISLIDFRHLNYFFHYISPCQLKISASLQSGKTLPSLNFGYHIIVDLIVKLQSWSVGKYTVPFHWQSTLVKFNPGFIVPVRAPRIGQIELFKSLLKINILVTWNYAGMCKLVILHWNTWKI